MIASAAPGKDMRSNQRMGGAGKKGSGVDRGQSLPAYMVVCRERLADPGLQPSGFSVAALASILCIAPGKDKHREEQR